jgi:IS1 family transposase/transposase-like protein
MILSYIDPKFCNITSLQSNLGDFSKNIAVFITKSRMKIKGNKEFEFVDTTVQTTLDDFGLKYNDNNYVKSCENVVYLFKSYLVVNLDYWFFDDIDDYVVVDMKDFDENNVKFYNKVNNSLYDGSVDDFVSNVHVLSDGSFEMLNPCCTNCGSYDVIKKDFTESNPKVEYHGNMKLRLKRYYCKNCNSKFQTKIASMKNDGETFSKDLREKVRESFANRGGSLDQIANDLKIFLNIEISHQQVKNMLQFDFDQVEYLEEFVVNKESNKDFEGLENTEYDKLYAIRKRKAKGMGYLVVDELFTNIKQKRWYSVCIHDISDKNVPFAVGVIKKRSLKNMKALYDFATRGMDIRSMTTDHFKAYEAIADDNEILHQQCIFHHIDDLNEDIYPVLKDKSISEVERMALARQTSEYRNIFRTYDEKEADFLWNSFLSNEDKLHEVFKDNSESITEHFLRHTQFTRDNFIPKTSNQAETFHSLPVVRQIKNTAKSPRGFLECMAVIMQYHKPTTRKQKRP